MDNVKFANMLCNTVVDSSEVLDELAGEFARYYAENVFIDMMLDSGRDTLDAFGNELSSKMTNAAGSFFYTLMTEFRDQLVGRIRNHIDVRARSLDLDVDGRVIGATVYVINR